MLTFEIIAYLSRTNIDYSVTMANCQAKKLENASSGQKFTYERHYLKKDCHSNKRSIHFQINDTSEWLNQQSVSDKLTLFPHFKEVSN